MFKIIINTTNNVLVLTLKGRFNEDEADRIYHEAEKNIGKLQNGFTAVMDWSHLDSLEINPRPFVERLMDLFNGHGVARVIRIIPKKETDIGFNIMSLFHYAPSVATHTYRSYQEAVEDFCSKKIWCSKDNVVLLEYKKNNLHIL